MRRNLKRPGLSPPPTRIRPPRKITAVYNQRRTFREAPVTLPNSSTSLLRPLLVALLAAACLAATPSQLTKIPVDDPASVQHLRESIADLTKRLEKTPGDIPARIELAGAYTQLAEFDTPSGSSRQQPPLRQTTHKPGQHSAR